MIKTKKLLAAALIPVLIPFASFAEDQQEEADKTLSQKMSDLVQNVKSELSTEKLWARAQKELRNAKLKQSVSLPTLNLVNGLSISGKYNYSATPSIFRGKYTAIDKWEVNFSAYPSLFDLSDLPVGIGASYRREITYIQQFDKQIDAVLRIPYDPISKLPLNSDIFFKTRKNIVTGQVEKVLKPGDFISYRAPMSLYVGKGLSEIALSHFGLSAGLSYVISADFDIQLFVMDDYTVRTRITTANNQGFGASVGVNIVGFNGVGKMIVKQLMNTDVLSIAMGINKSNLFVADYIFNLKHEESKALYNKLIGSKFRLINKDILLERILSPFAGEKANRERAMANLEDISKVVAEDANKPYSERRILKVITAQNITESISTSARLQLFKIFRAEASQTKSGSRMTLYASRDDVKARYKLDSYSQSASYKFLHWGESDVESNNFLSQIDDKSRVTDIVGLQNSVHMTDKQFNLAEFEKYKTKLKKTFPAKIVESLDLPNWNFGKDQRVNNASGQQDIIFNDAYFNNNWNLTEETIKERMVEIINSRKQEKALSALPIGLDNYTSSNVNEGGDIRMHYHQLGMYEEAFQQELAIVPNRLSMILNSQVAASSRQEALKELYETVPLYREIQSELLLKLAPEDQLEKVLTVRLVMTAKDQTTLITEFPKTESSKANNLFREIMAQKGYIDDNSINLRTYMREDGYIYSVKEIMDTRAEKGLQTNFNAIQQ